MERLKEKERAKAHHQWHPPSHASRQRSHLTTASKHKPHSFRFPREGVCLRLGSSPPPRAAHTATINTRTCNVVLINSSRTHRVIISASITITQERESTRSLLCLYLSRLPYRAHSHTHITSTSSLIATLSLALILVLCLKLQTTIVSLVHNTQFKRFLLIHVKRG